MPSLNLVAAKVFISMKNSGLQDSLGINLQTLLASFMGAKLATNEKTEEQINPSEREENSTQESMN